MRKLIPFLSLTILLLSSSSTQASYVTIRNNGDVIIKVLANQIEKNGSSIQVTKLAENPIENTTPAVKLTKNNDTVQMVVTNSDGTKELHIPEKTDTLIEIEERPETQKIAIGVQGEQFFLRENKYIALTPLPLTIDAQSAHLVATSDNGDTLLSILPLEAAEAVLRSGIVTKITDNTMQILEENNTLQYKISGEKTFSLLNVYDYTVPVDTYVSISDGSITKINSSTWYRFVNFLVG
jgi:hypothetical protein